MTLISRDTPLWVYMPPEIRGLIEDGEILVDFVRENRDSPRITDYSFLVFPFAKAYEGFLKKLFLDIGMIKPDEYYGDDIRIGRILNPQYQHEKGNLFSIACEHSPDRRDLALELWNIWKRGRNSVFHFFPHNFRRLSYEEATDLVNDFLRGMSIAVARCDVPRSLV